MRNIGCILFDIAMELRMTPDPMTLVGSEQSVVGVQAAAPSGGTWGMRSLP
jgi:hypothetical protein